MVTLSASDTTYDGNPKTAAIEGEIKGFDTPSITYEKKTDNGYSAIEAAPTDAGTYRASITYTVGEENSKVYSVSVEYTIGKAEAEKTAECKMNFDYDEATNCYTAMIEPVEGAEYKFGESGVWSSQNKLEGIAHDTQVTGYIRIAGDDNHNPGAECSKTLTSGHGTMKHYEAKAADCVTDGNLEYWYCESCGKYFSDANGTTETTKDAVTNGTAKGHQWDTETYTFDATHHWHNCQNENCPITDNSQKNGYGEHVDENGDGACDTCSEVVDAYMHLQTLITSVENIVQGDYSDVSWQAFKTALAAAKVLTETSTDEELTAAYEALDNAKKGLKLGTFIVGTVASPSNTGKQTGGGRYAVGETVTLTAEGVEGWTFNGWYESDKLISDKAEVTFTVTDGMSGTAEYTAKYTHVSHNMDEKTHKCSICGTDYYKVTFTGAVTSETYTTGNVEFPAGDYIFKAGSDVIDTSDYTVSGDTTITVESLAEAAKYAVTITRDEHCSLTVMDSNGNIVVSGDTVAAGTILKVSVKVDDGYTLTTTPESSYTVDKETTIKAVTEAKKYAVTVDNTYYQNSEAEAPTASEDDLTAVPYGTSLTLTAADANTGYEFLGWYQTNGKQLTAEKEYTVTITSTLTVQPRYQKNSGTVIFVANGAVVGTIADATGDTEIVFPSGVSAYIGFEFTGWNKTADQIHSALKNGENVVVTALFEQIKRNYVVSVYNAEETNAETMTLTESKYISVTAKDIAGKNFAYWMLDGDIQSYNKTVTFRVTESCTLRAVYSAEVTQALGTALIKSGSYDISTHKLTVLGYMTVPDANCKIVSAGLYAASANSVKYNANDELTGDNADYVKASAKAVGTAGPLSYTWTKSNVSAGDIWYVRPYIKYTDASGEAHTVYGERITLCAGTEYDPSEKATAKINAVSYDSTSSKAKFIAYLAVPENAVIQKSGLVAKSEAAGFNPNMEILSANNAQYVKSSALAVGTNGPVTYTWTKSNVNINDIWYVRAYLVYIDQNGNEHTVYGDLLKYNAQ